MNKIYARPISLRLRYTSTAHKAQGTKYEKIGLEGAICLIMKVVMQRFIDVIQVMVSMSYFQGVVLA